MIRITYEFATESEALGFLTGHQPVVAPDETVPVKAARASKKAAAPETQGTGAAVTAKSEPTPPAAAAPQTAAPTTALNAPAPAGEMAKSAAAAPTADTIRTALMAVFKKPGGQGAAAATAILKKFNATRVSDIKPEQYADFLKACA
jgi:hypothetical protein